MELAMSVGVFVWLMSTLQSFGQTKAQEVKDASQLTAQSQARLPPLMEDRDREISIARGAGPEYISKDATIYVLRRGGFVRSIEGTNGFTCLVLREGVEGLAPICYDKEGSQTILLAKLRQAELVEQGKSEADAEREVYEGYRKGKFRAPRRGGVAYMLSKENHLCDPTSGTIFLYPPHVMIYAPYIKNSDIGATSAQRGSTIFPWVLHEGQPDAYIMVTPRTRE
jgi:hypothetical protein